MDKTIRVMILEDHQSIVDGYLYRLGTFPGVEVVSAITFGEELVPALKEHPADVLLLDVNVPTAPDNPNPYPILHTIPKLLQMFPQLDILVISMYAERALIHSVMEAGASGYILKDDSAAIQDLGSVVLSVAGGGIYFSQKAHRLYAEDLSKDERGSLTARQLEAVSLCAAYPNCTSADLAQKMDIAHSTLRNLLSSAYVKLGVRNRAAAVTKARQSGLITPDPPNPVVSPSRAVLD
jgi:two-component system nitrate/nitrite response regulator NarL